LCSLFEGSKYRRDIIPELDVIEEGLKAKQSQTI
jgi:hypothetical protein